MPVTDTDRLAALARISSLLRGGVTARDALHGVIAGMADVIPADAYAIWRYQHRTNEWRIVASAGLSPEYVDHVVVETAANRVRPDAPMLIENLRALPDTGRREFYEKEGIRSMLVIPLHLRGESAGTIICYYREPRALDERDLQLASVISDVASAAFDARKLDRFAEAARVTSGELDLGRIVQAVTDAATEMTNAQFGAFFYNVVDGTGESYTLYTISGVPREAFSRFPMPRNTPVFEPTFAGRGTVRSADIRKDPRYGQNPPYNGMPAGHLPVVSYLAVPVISRSGEVLGGLFFGHSEEGVFTETEEQITEALAAQAAVAIDNARLYDALQREREQLRSSETRFRFLAQASDLLACSLDYETTLTTLVQMAVPEIADWCAVDVVDENGTSRRLAVAHVDPDKVALAREIRERYPPDPATDTIARVIRTGKSEWMAHIPQEMLDARAHDDEHRRIIRELGLLSFMIVPLRAHDRILGALSFILSESQRRYSEADLAIAEELGRRGAVSIVNSRLYTAAQAANQAKDDFLATLSHELRTPMTAVVGWSRMLRMGLSPSETHEAVDAIERSATVQMQLIEDILDMSRIMAGKLRIETSPVDLSRVTEAALVTVRPAAETKEIDILTSYPPQAPYVLGDEGRLHQIVWNLLTNATKFTNRGGRVLVRIDGTAEMVSLTVRDTGVGIDPAFLPHVFERFRQQDSSTTRAHGGIGLGLAIVRHLVELHGGRIRAESEGTGRGATFVIELPAMATAAARRMTGAKVAVDPAMPSLEGIAVLLIDDQQMTRDVVAAILRRGGASVITVDSVQSSREVLAHHQPDVVVCDIAMPVEDGYVFLDELRTRERGGVQTPVIALTAFGRPEDQQKALASGFDAFLKKPVDPVLLASTVRELRLSRESR